MFTPPSLECAPAWGVHSGSYKLRRLSICISSPPKRKTLQSRFLSHFLPFKSSKAFRKMDTYAKTAPPSVLGKRRTQTVISNWYCVRRRAEWISASVSMVHRGPAGGAGSDARALDVFCWRSKKHRRSSVERRGFCKVSGKTPGPDAGQGRVRRTPNRAAEHTAVLF